MQILDEELSNIGTSEYTPSPGSWAGRCLFFDSSPRDGILNKIASWRSMIKRKEKKRNQQTERLQTNIHTGSVVTPVSNRCVPQRGTNVWMKHRSMEQTLPTAMRHMVTKHRLTQTLKQGTQCRINYKRK